MFLHLFVCLLYLQGVQWGWGVVCIPICNGAGRGDDVYPNMQWGGGGVMWAVRILLECILVQYKWSHDLVKLYLNVLSLTE